MGILGSLGLKLAVYWSENSSKVIAIGVITVITLSILGYGYYKIDQGGYQRAYAEWKDSEAKINSDNEKLLEQRQSEYEEKLQQNSNAYYGAWKHYVEINEASNRDRASIDNNRLLVRTDCAKSDRNTMPAATEVSKGTVRQGDGTDWAELGTEDSRAIQETAIDARQMSMQYRLLLEKMNEAGMFE